MIPSMHSEPDFTLLSSLWTDVRGTAEASDLERELVRETPPGHVLADVAVSAVAARKLRKEVVYRLPDGRWAWVHLTWRQETGSVHPRTEIRDSWSAIVDELVDVSRE